MVMDTMEWMLILAYVLAEHLAATVHMEDQ